MHLTRFHWDDNTFDYAQQGLKQKFPEAFLDPKIQPLFELDWHNYLCDKKRVRHQIHHQNILFRILYYFIYHIILV